jgi:uncharacterized protein YjbI with pentapeptide repeats
MSAASDLLRKRWTTADGDVLAGGVFARLIAGRPLDDLALPRHEGLVDLRYLPGPIPARLRRFAAAGRFVEELSDTVTLRKARLVGLDLSCADLRSFRFHDSILEGCRIDKANCRDWRLWGTTVRDCSFVGADLRDAAVGTWVDGRRNEWQRVRFDGADFRVAASQGAVFLDCDFSSANLAKVKFEQCDLERCVFAGRLREVVFDGREIGGRPASRPMVDVDFRNAHFSDVEFMGSSLGAVALPEDPDVRLIRRYRCVVTHALTRLEGDGSLQSRMLRGELLNRIRMMRGEEEDNVFNRRDYVQSGGEQLAEFASEVFGRGEESCRS